MTSFRRVGAVYCVVVVLLTVVVAGSLFYHFRPSPHSAQHLSNYVSDYILEVEKLNKILEECHNTKIMAHLGNATMFPTTSNVEQLILTLQKSCSPEVLPNCTTSSAGHYSLSKENEEDLASKLIFVNYGGWWAPSDCRETEATAIIIPFSPWNYQGYRNLTALMRQLHPILRRQKLHYRIFVVLQDRHSSFNRGKLFNVGFVEALRMYPYSCFIFHDVDLLPHNDETSYTCRHSPAYIPVASSIGEGGVYMFRMQHFRAVNGFPNSLFTGFMSGGGEDEMFLWRVKQTGMKFHYYQTTSYTLLRHRKSEIDRTSAAYTHARFLVKEAEEKEKGRGLNFLQYFITDLNAHKWATFIDVDLKRNFWY